VVKTSDPRRREVGGFVLASQAPRRRHKRNPLAASNTPHVGVSSAGEGRPAPPCSRRELRVLRGGRQVLSCGVKPTARRRARESSSAAPPQTTRRGVPPGGGRGKCAAGPFWDSVSVGLPSATSQCHAALPPDRPPRAARTRRTSSYPTHGRFGLRPK